MCRTKKKDLLQLLPVADKSHLKGADTLFFDAWTVAFP